MALALAFDTHAFIKRLAAVGMPEPQAEMVTTLLGEAQALTTDELATKADIREVRVDIAHLEAATKADLHAEIARLESKVDAVRAEAKADLRESEQRLTAAMKEIELRLTLRLGGMIAVGIAILAAMKFFGH